MSVHGFHWYHCTNHSHIWSLTPPLPSLQRAIADKKYKMSPTRQTSCLEPISPAWHQDSLSWMVFLGWKLHTSGSPCHPASCASLLLWATVDSSTSSAMRRPCIAPCTTFWPCSPSPTSPCAPPRYPTCCAYSGSTLRRLPSMAAWPRCFLSTCWLGWSLGCSCSWRWTAMWPSATPYAMPPSSPVLSLPRLVLPLSWGVWCSSLHSLSLPSACPIVEATSSPTRTVTTCLWPRFPVAKSRSTPSMVSWQPSWLGALICSVFPCLTLWSCEQWWVCLPQMLVTKPSAPVRLTYVLLSLHMFQPYSPFLLTALGKKTSHLMSIS